MKHFKEICNDIIQNEYCVVPLSVHLPCMTKQQGTNTIKVHMDRWLLCSEKKKAGKTHDFYYSTTWTATSDASKFTLTEWKSVCVPQWEFCFHVWTGICHVQRRNRYTRPRPGCIHCLVTPVDLLRHIAKVWTQFRVLESAVSFIARLWVLRTCEVQMWNHCDCGGHDLTSKP